MIVMAATCGNWNDVWDAFDRRKSAKSVAAANEDAGEGAGLFGIAGVAAE